MYVYSVLMLEEIEFYGKKVQVKQAWLAMRGTLIRSILKLWSLAPGLQVMPLSVARFVLTGISTWVLSPSRPHPPASEFEAELQPIDWEANKVLQFGGQNIVHWKLSAGTGRVGDLACPYFD